MGDLKIKVLLVDDEPIELDLLEHSINWEELGISQIRRASNGKRALQMIREEMPDIVITDIRMPVMDGLALARHITAEELPVKIIFLTGYDDFSYIQVAFRVAAVDYVLKPVIPVKIRSVLRQTIERIQKEKGLRTSIEVSRYLSLEQLIQGETSEELCRTFEGDTSRYFLIMVFGKWEKQVYKKVPREIPGVSYGAFGLNACVFLLEENLDPPIIARQILENLPETRAWAAVCYTEAKEVKELHGAYEVCISYVDRIFMMGPGTVLSAVHTDTTQKEELSAAMLRPVIDGLTAIIPEGDAEATEQAVKTLFTEIKSRSRKKKQVTGCLKELLRWLEAYFIRRNPDIKLFLAHTMEMSAEEIENSVFFSCAQKSFQSYLMQIHSCYQMQGHGKKSWVVRQVKEYVEMNYRDSLNLEQLGQKLYLSVNYIRTIFKEQTGDTILEYITDYRFSKAEQLLKDKRLKIGDVSRMVGYDNVSYFTSLFTKRYGISPRDYQNRF